MKIITANFRLHLDGSVTSIATLWRIIRADGTIFYFTDHDQDVPFDGNIYSADTGYNRSAISSSADLSVDNLDVEGVFDSAQITKADIRSGLFDYAEVYVSLVNWADPDGDGQMKVRRGWFGEVQATQQGTYRAELRGMAQALQQNVLDHYQAECRTDLGSAQCKVPIDPPVLGREEVLTLKENGGTTYRRVVTDGGGSGYEQYENRVYQVTVAGTTAVSAPTYDTVIGNPTVDGTATLVAVDAWTREAVVASVTDNKNFSITVTESRAVDDWFRFGALRWETGNNAGATAEIKSWLQSGSDVVLYLDMPFTVAVADKMSLYPGCNKAWAGAGGCVAKFNNGINHRGFAFIPGEDEMLSYPDSRSGGAGGGGAIGDGGPTTRERYPSYQEP